MSFNAIALSDQFENGRCSGMLETTPGGLRFKDRQMQVYNMPLRGVEMRIGGAGNRFVFFSHPKVPGFTFYTDDRSILNADEIRFDPELKKVLAALKNKNRFLWTLVTVFTGLLLFGILSMFIFRGQIVEHIANLIPPESEREISESMRQSAIAGKMVLKDSALLKKLQLITDPLVQALNEPSFSFSFTVIKDPTLNAFALPGGAVVIHSGLIEKAKSAEEVAGVLAHEISHVSRRHHLRGIIGNMGIFIIIRGFLGDMAGVSSDIANAGASLSSLKYSRDFEREADVHGFKLLQAAKINTDGMIRFFETMAEENADIKMADFMSTHPGTDERIKRLKKQKKKIGESIPIPIDFERFQSEMKTYFKTQ